MKKFLVSVAGGCLVGGLLAWAFIVGVPKLPDVFAKAFFTPVLKAPAAIAQNIQESFKPKSEQYFIDPVDRAIPQDAKVVYADLGSMKIALYDKGQHVGEYPIKSVGREGTAWQTPIGKFDMSYKMKNHFSSIGHVYMPFSMHFFGNYFIHGWPYYPDGTPVAEGYSGGCIRLTTLDAEQIYGFVDKETQLIVTTAGEMQKQSDFVYEVHTASPELSANYLIADLENGEVVAQRGAKNQVAIGSFAKLMTAIISLETLNQYQQIVLRQDIVKVADVLYALVLNDDDEAGTALSEHKNKGQYLEDMDTRAASLAMSQTTYFDPNGTSPKTLSNLEDTFRLLQYMDSYKPFMLKLLSANDYKIAGIEHNAIHPMKDDESYVAGFANAEDTELITLVTIDVPGSEEGQSQKKTFAILVQNSQDADTDTAALHDWIKASVRLQ